MHRGFPRVWRCWCLVRTAGIPGFVLLGRDTFDQWLSHSFTLSSCFLYYSWSWKSCAGWTEDFSLPEHWQGWTSGQILPGVLGPFISMMLSLVWGNVSCASSKGLLLHLAKWFRSPWTYPVWRPSEMFPFSPLDMAPLCWNAAKLCFEMDSSFKARGRHHSLVRIQLCSFEAEYGIPSVLIPQECSPPRRSVCKPPCFWVVRHSQK